MAGMSLDVFEQQRRALLQADQIGDVGRFEIGAHFGGDALEFAHRLGLFQPDIKLAGVGTVARLRCSLGFVRHCPFLGRDGDTHIHGHFPTLSTWLRNIIVCLRGHIEAVATVGPF